MDIQKQKRQPLIETEQHFQSNDEWSVDFKAYITNKIKHTFEIPELFIKRYIFHRSNYGILCDSYITYDLWFHRYYADYDTFIADVHIKLIKQLEYETRNLSFYITPNALQYLETTMNHPTRAYYAKLNVLYDKFQQKQINLHTQQLREAQQMIEQREDQIYQLKLKYFRNQNQ